VTRWANLGVLLLGGACPSGRLAADCADPPPRRELVAEAAVDGLLASLGHEG
jgi:hypothetical protein